ncbi:MAG TPA: haloacid dehalogenase, partial [Microbacteriaceae bacterium]|nr:haloacid dehalogenase [Microbacteriaceae bacterium]
GAKQLFSAPPEARPDYILGDLRGLFEPYPETKTRRGSARCADAAARVDGAELIVDDRGTGLDRLRAAVHAVWSSGRAVYALNIPERALRLPGLP